MYIFVFLLSLFHFLENCCTPLTHSVWTRTSGHTWMKKVRFLYACVCTNHWSEIILIFRMDMHLCICELTRVSVLLHLNIYMHVKVQKQLCILKYNNTHVKININKWRENLHNRNESFLYHISHETLTI